MPELPDITIYVEALESRIVGAHLLRVEVRGPFLLRSVTPSLESTFGLQVQLIRRVGKRIAIGLEGGLWLVLHLRSRGGCTGEGPPQKARRSPALVRRTCWRVSASTPGR